MSYDEAGLVNIQAFEGNLQLPEQSRDSGIPVMMKQNFGNILLKACKSITEKVNQSGFRKSVIFPWNPSASYYT